MVDIDDAILATTTVSPGKISVGEGEAGPRSQVLSIANSGASPVTYDLTSVNALSTGGVVTPSFTTSDASVAFSASSVTVPAGGKASVTATITPATGPHVRSVRWLYRAYAAGRWPGIPRAVRRFRRRLPGHPGGDAEPRIGFAVARGPVTRAIYYQVTGPQDWVYTLANGDVPNFLIHFEHQVQELQAVIKYAKSGAPVHPVFNLGIDEEYLPRNSTTTGFFAFALGRLAHPQQRLQRQWLHQGPDASRLPDGEYIVEIRALKANGNRAQSRSIGRRGPRR